MLTYILFVAGFAVLIYGAGWLVGGASSLAKKYNIPDLIIGLTIVAFGTSAPELAVNIFASARDSSEIAIGNILGSNIFNILLILGIASIIYPLKVQQSTINKEIPFSLLAAIVLGIAANDMILDGRASSMLGRSDGLIFLCFFLLFMYYTFTVAKKGQLAALEEGFKPMPLWKSVALIVAGLTGLVLGGHWIVTGAVEIATSLGVSESVIGLTVVALGTSLPELATSAVAAFKKNTDIAIGNVVGSNIFNIFLVLGVSATVLELPFQTASNIDIGMVILASLLLFFFVLLSKTKTIDRKKGIAFLVILAVYLFYLVKYVA